MSVKVSLALGIIVGIVLFFVLERRGLIRSSFRAETSFSFDHADLA